MVNLWHKWYDQPIWKKIIIGLMMGILAGLLFGESMTILKPIGQAFINSLHMVIVPVILSAVVCAVVSISDFKQMRRITIKSFLVYLSFLCIAILIAILVGNIIKPGLGFNEFHTVKHFNNFNYNQLTSNEISVKNINSAPELLDLIVHMIPSNPVASFVNENILQIVVFGILLGLSIGLAGEQGKPVAQLFFSISQVSVQLTNIVMKFAPYGVFALIAPTFGLFGIKALLPLLKFILTLFISCTILILFYSLILLIYLKKSVKDFFKKIMPAIIFAASTTSSGATLPVSMKCAEEGLRIQPGIAKFMLPLGCNFNLAGLAIYLSLAIMFTANMYAVTLNLSNYILLLSTVVLTTMGTGAIPGSAIVVMSAVITSMGLPLGALPLIAGIDRVNDMIQTTTNVISDIFAAYLISESENKAASNNSIYITDSTASLLK